MPSFPSPTLSFIPGLKPSFSANPSHRSLSFSSSGLTTWIPETFTDTSEHIRFYFLVFFFHFLVVGSMRWIKLTHVGFRAHVKIASRIVLSGEEPEDVNPLLFCTARYFYQVIVSSARVIV